jgi:DNA-binding NtrC family response regulator
MRVERHQLHAHRLMSATILVLDAEEVIRSVITKILEREGYTVHATGDLPSALELVKDCTPDLLLTNLYIPGISGHDAAKFLQSRCPNMRVLVVAGLPDDRLIEDRIKGDGFDAFPKPFNSKQLSEKVKEVLDGSVD